MGGANTHTRSLIKGMLGIELLLILAIVLFRCELLAEAEGVCVGKYRNAV